MIFEAVAARRSVVAEAAAKTKAARREHERGRHLRLGDGAGGPAGGDAAATHPVDDDIGDTAEVPMPTEADRGSVEDWS
jgi:hypothetical protein